MIDKINIKISVNFDNWLRSLQSARARHHILAKLRSLTLHDLSGEKLIGEGLYEMRIDYSRGYRLYYKRRDNAVILVCGSGYRSERERDIAAAKAMAEGL